MIIAALITKAIVRVTQNVAFESLRKLEKI